MRILRAALGGLLTAAVLAGPAIAFAAGDEGTAAPYLAVRGVDSTGGDVVRLTVAYEGDEGDLSGAVITDNGRERELSGDVVALATTGASRAVVIAVDTSEAMDPVMADIRDAVTAIVAGLPSDAPVGIVTFADRVVPVRALTTDRDRVLDTISQLQANGESVLWDGIAGAAELLAGEAPEAQPSVVVVTGSGNFASASTSGDAVGALRNAGAPAYVVGLEGDRLDQNGLEDVVGRAGGRLLTTADSEALDEMGTTMAATIDEQYVLAYEPPTGDEAGAVADVQVEVGDSMTAATFVRGSETGKPADLFAEAPAPVNDGLLQSDLAKFVGVALILLAVALGAFALIMLTQRDDSHLTNVLLPYSEGFVDESSVDDDDDASGLAKTALIQRAVEMTGDFAERQGFLAGVEAKLERADLPLRAAEALFFYAAMVGVVGLLSLVLTQNLIGAVVCTVLAIMIPKAAVNFKAKRRLKKFNNQLPDMLSLLSGTLRAGYSLMQGVEAVSREVEDPIGYELRRVVTESRLGRPLDESLDAAAERMGSADFRWAVMAIGIQREVGGNLAELLMTVSETMTARERLRRDVDALTAEGKVSATVLGLLPLGLGAAMFVINPEYIGVLFSEKLGNMMLGGAVLLALFGFWWMKKLIEIDV
jgi:tight adherence protein B